MSKNIKKICVVGMAIVFTLCASELLYRLFVYKSCLINTAAFTRSHRSLCEYDSLLGWRHKKNAQKTFIAPEYKSLILFNSKGFRGSEPAYAKDNNVYRVLIIGDSFAEGYVVNQDDVFSEILKNNLSQIIKDKTIEIVNAGVGGYSTDQELLFMMEEGYKFQPDLTLLMFFGNDVYYNTQSIYYKKGKPYFVFENKTLVSKNTPVPKSAAEFKKNNVRNFLKKRLYLFSFLMRKKLELSTNAEHILPKEDRIYLVTYEAAIEHSWFITEKIIQKLKQFVDSEKNDLLIVYIPPKEAVHRFDYQAYLDYYDTEKGVININKPASILSGICTRNGISFLDLTSDLQLSGQSKRLYYRRDAHWNKEGNRVVGQLLAQYIAKHYF